MREATITVRSPEALKCAVDAACELRGMTLTGFVRSALQDVLTPPARVYELPGLSHQFSDFLSAVGTQQVLLLVVDPQGHRQLVSGHPQPDYSNESLVSIVTSSMKTVPVLRRDVAGWYCGESSKIAALVQTLSVFGWSQFRL